MDNEKLISQAVALYDGLCNVRFKLNSVLSELGPAVPAELTDALVEVSGLISAYQSAGMPTSIFPVIGADGSVAS